MKNTYQTAKIIKVEKETEKVRNFTLDISLKAKPGQYIMVWIPGENEKPFGIASPSPLVLSIANVGVFTKKMHQLQKGEKITLRGPYGKGYRLKGKKWLLVGGGYGVVPLYFLASSISREKIKNATVIIGAKTKKELPFVSKFRKLGCGIKISTDDGSFGFKGFTTELMEKILNNESFDLVYTCGPMVMMKKIAEICKKNKIPCQAGLESFFKCGGIGLCGECSFKGHLVCKEGPVFNARILLD